MLSADNPLRTTPPIGGGYVVLYDGRCRFCTASARRLRRLGAPTVRYLDFHTPGLLASFPGITSQACQRGLQLITPDGAAYSGAQAIARVLSTSPVLSPLAALYFVPGLRALFDHAYALIARNRYRIGGFVPGGACQTGHCSLDHPACPPPPVSAGKPSP